MPKDPIPDGPPVELHVGRVFRVTAEPIRYPGGRTSTYDIVRHPGAVAVLPIVLDPLAVVLLHQFRFATGGRIWEIPAGTLDRPGEPPQDCARRELIEETGLQAGTVREVTQFYTAPGFCDERMWLYAAWDLEPAEEHQPGDDDELIEPHHLPWPRVCEMLRAGEIQDAKTLAALGWLQGVVTGQTERP